MIPAEFKVVPSLPRTQNGKIDYARLKELPDEGRVGAVSKLSDSLEFKIAANWQEVLRIEKIDVNSNFFELGGDSLNAIELISLLQDQFPTEVPILALFFEDPTVAGLARAIRETLIDGARYDVNTSN